MKVWTFGDRVPGPVARVRVAELVKVTIRNTTTMPHSIDFHAARIAPDKAFTDVMPGESWSFEFRATTAGVFMYHCGTAPVVHHIANGMYGMIIVEPEGGLPKVDRELAFVPSDFYVSDTPGNPADDAKLENLSIGNQTLNLAASQGAVAEFRLDQEGIYPFVGHDFTSVA